MSRQQDEMTAHIKGLEGDYEVVLSEVLGFQRSMAQQDELMQNVLQYVLRFGHDDGFAAGTPLPLPMGMGPGAMNGLPVEMQQ